MCIRDRAQSWQLSVEPGQEVILARSANGWAQIRLCSDPATMGGVPDEYLELIAEPVQSKFDAFDHSGLPPNDPGPAAAEPLLVSEPQPEPEPEPKPEPVALETPPVADVQPAPTHRVKHSFTAAQSWQLNIEPGQEVILARLSLIHI